MTEFEKLEQRVHLLESLLFKIVKSDRYVFERDIELSNGRNIMASTGSGSKIGTASTQKLGFYGATPVARQTALTAADGSTVDTTYGAQEAAVIENIRTRVGEIGTALSNLGFIA